MLSLQKPLSTEGYDELTSDQKLYFTSEKFKLLLQKEILPSLHPELTTMDNYTFLIIQKDAKWNRIYLKEQSMYMQLRIFPSKTSYCMYMESYSKIVLKFVKFMPTTVYCDESRSIVVQKLGDFSLRDFANLVLLFQANKKK